MRKKVFLILLSFSFCVILKAQTIEIKGVISDTNGLPIPGASVVEKGTTNGSSADFDGEYSIEASMGSTLVFSYVGYSEKEVVVTSSEINVSLPSGIALESVVVIGSRNPSRTATETAVPVDVIDMIKLIEVSPQTNLNNILNYVAPSFTSNVQNISDGTDHIDPASLRGLGPDQVLVLINGKRRHNSSLVNVNGTFGRGNVGTDLNAIPASAIKRVEVLRDGAAAQYGSDAIAGVINIVLKDNTDELSVNVSTGTNMSANSNGQTGGMDGETTNLSASYGIKLGDKGGYVNFSGDFDVRKDYSRMKEWEGGIFNAYNSIENVANKDGFDLRELPGDLAKIKEYGNSVTHFSSALKASIATAADIPALQTILNADVTEEELTARNQKRSDYNMRVGQSALRGGRFFANFLLPLNEERTTKLYAFSGYSSRKGNSAGFYRLPSQNRTYTPIYINGFLPEINSTIDDRSLAVGITGKINNWNVDFSNTYGTNSFLYTIGNTSNASLQNATPALFDAGGFAFTQNTTNVDFNSFYSDIFNGLNVGLGAEYRQEIYEVFAGEEGSYSQYQSDGSRVELSTDVPASDFFGRTRPGGSQVFPGFSPDNELSRERSSIASYIDLEADLTEAFLLNLASRFEDYSDFGSTLNFKVAMLFKSGENTNWRTALNTGFRAPSLHQLNFNSTSTIFDQNGDAQEVGTFSNDSRAAKLLGIPKLKEETSQSISVGITHKVPSANLTLTLDAYLVAIADRIVYTGQFSGEAGTELGNILSQANASKAAFFANAIDTQSQGLDFVVTHNHKLGTNLNLKTDLSGTFSKTERVGSIKSSELIKSAGKESTYFDESSRVYLEEAVPRTKGNLSFTLASNKYTVFLRNVYFGEVTEATGTIENQQIFSSKLVSDLSVGYNLSKTLNLTVGANNLLDIYPDKAATDLQSNVDGDQNNRSGGRFDWSRRSQQFGIGGRFVFARLSLKIR